MFEQEGLPNKSKMVTPSSRKFELELFKTFILLLYVCYFELYELNLSPLITSNWDEAWTK